MPSFCLLPAGGPFHWPLNNNLLGDKLILSLLIIVSSN